jgi:hypothetical protein
MQSAKWKAKYEQAKPGKKMRMIMDLGVPASLRGAWLTDMLKIAQEAVELENNNFRFMFCKMPTYSRLKQIFDEMAVCDRPLFVYFSDDSCLAVRINGRIKWFNLDISSCDASHTRALFDLLVFLFPDHMRDDIRALVKQCQTRLIVKSTTDPTKNLVLVPLEPRLYSGSTLTTAINNLANLLIGLAISECLDFDVATLDAAIRGAGYIVTGLKPLDVFEDVQFLKHSPTLDRNGEYQPILNLGVLLRATGSCDGDVPGRGPLRPRCETFQSQVVSGMYPRVITPVVDNMLSAVTDYGLFSDDKAQRVYSLKAIEETGDPILYVPTESFAARYRLTPLDLSELIDYSNLKYGQFYNAPCLQKILSCDYGLTTVTHQLMEYTNGYVCSSAT